MPAATSSCRLTPRGWVLGAVAIAACTAPPFDRAEAEKAVLAAVLEAQVGPPSDTAHIVLDPVFVGSLPVEAAALLDAPLLADLREALAEDSVVLPLPSAYRISIDTMDAARPAARDSILNGPIVSGAGFEVTGRAYPGAWAVHSVSHVGFSRNRRRAAMYLVMYCGALCGGGNLIELRFRGGSWVVVRNEPLWVS